MKTRTLFRHALVRVVRRPWPWLLRYLLALFPAALVAMLLLVPLRGWFRQPVVIEALETQSLDLLLDGLRALPTASAVDGLLWLAGLLAVPVIWAALRLVWLWLEGALLTTYAADAPPSPRAFVRAGFRWLGTFLLIGLLLAAISAMLVVSAILLGLLARMVWRPLAMVIAGAGAVLIAAMVLYGELARTAAVVSGDKHAVRAFGRAASVVCRRPLSLLALILGTLVLRGLLFLAQRELSLAIPLSWWAATLIVQQAIQVAITGASLLRRAGEVGLAAKVLEAEAQELGDSVAQRPCL
ncbi:MAG: hypothetical protein JXC32_03520 [Anaerolineae bacterium]|nr:hypothetical protein [Anaerolineae bacterium]